MGKIISRCKSIVLPDSQLGDFQNNNYGYNPSIFQPQNTTTHIDTNLQLISPREPQLKLAAIVVTVCEGTSYDPLFTSQEQKSENGTQTLVYACNQIALKDIMEAFERKSKNSLALELVEQIKSIDVDCTVFNWECCSSYCICQFSAKTLVFTFMRFMLDRGHMLMFSDYSLKALIEQWDESLFGKNPFLWQKQQYSGNVLLKFNAETLKKSPSAQLQLVGSLSDKGKCNVNADACTIIYTVDWEKVKQSNYKMQVLSVASNIPAEPNCQIGSASGAAGHCLITYPKGGKFLTSMTHWVSLMQIDTSQKKIIQVAEQNFGTSYACQMKRQMNEMDDSRKRQYIQKRAVEYVQRSAPCNNLYQKSKYM